MLGISIYLSENEQDNMRRIEDASKYGIDKIFTSLHIPEDGNKEEQPDLFKRLCEYAKKHSMEVYGDFGPDSFKRMGLDINDIKGIYDIGISGIRIDYGYDDEIIAEISKGIRIFLNASTLTREQIVNLKELGANFNNIEAWHNFYPRPETGLDKVYFIEKNKMIKSFGIKVSAYVVGDKIKRGPLFLGLPTLESHRYESTYNSAVELLYEYDVDDVYIGDIEACTETLERMAYLKDNIIVLRYKKEFGAERYKELLNKTYTSRGDESRDVIRAEESRGYAGSNSTIIKKENTIERYKGSITIDNEGYKRYMGELQITKDDLSANENVNVLGKIINEDKNLINFIKGRVRFKLIEA
ncbi:DUF871 domain-containing protein [Clostridium paridis]|uniref:DUF871 domain-containing protein n=1 Tax=Clostridium paridis TaxID=2803863 RepID=A0A937FGF0_9CLOT|nr:MupG family TIM beta-alpha barrel fold protein [Clostridium paridis]MBL4931548.1 DUF871 domain-containing protein [Clostridium paridis]